jgi:hypothetical protein
LPLPLFHGVIFSDYRGSFVLNGYKMNFPLFPVRMIFAPTFLMAHFPIEPNLPCSFIKQNDFHFSPCWLILNPAFCHLIKIENSENSSVEQNEKRRLDCAAFLLTAEETEQTKRRDMHLDGDALNVRF